MRFDPSGHLLSEWGPRLGDTTLGQPAGVAVQADSVYWVLDRGNPRLFRLDSSGRVLGILSLEGLGTYGLNGLAVDAGGNLYVADTGRNRILVLSPMGILLRQIGHQGNDLGAFIQPMNLAFAPDGSFFVADWENARIERFDATYTATDAWSTGFRPFGVVVDQLGRVFAPDADRRLVEAYTPRGALLGELSGPGATPLDVTPRQLAFARAGQPALYALGGDGITRLVLENTPPPPQGGPGDFDVLSLVLFLLLLGSLAAAFLARRGRRRRVASVGALDGPVRLYAKNGAQRQNQQPQANQQLLVAHQAKGENQAAEEHEQAEQDAEARHHV
jgi:DNA-binding beta-propeller fold protein YncE